MADEHELRRALREHAGELPAIDVDDVVRRARGRRRSRRLVAGAGVVASAAAVVAALVVTIPPGGSMVSGVAESSTADDAAPGSAEESADAFSASGPAPAHELNACGGPVAPAADVEGLTVDVDFPAEAPLGGPLNGAVVLTNTGSVPLVGSTAAPPATALGADGTVLWHAEAPVGVVALELAPGASVRLDAVVQPVRCSAAGEARQPLPADAPPVPAGAYTVSVAVDVALSDGRVLQAVSAPEPVALR